jgi:hypothetical protein
MLLIRFCFGLDLKYLEYFSFKFESQECLCVGGWGQEEVLKGTGSLDEIQTFGQKSFLSKLLNSTSCPSPLKFGLSFLF